MLFGPGRNDIAAATHDGPPEAVNILLDSLPQTRLPASSRLTEERSFTRLMRLLTAGTEKSPRQTNAGQWRVIQFGGLIPPALSHAQSTSLLKTSSSTPQSQRTTPPTTPRSCPAQLPNARRALETTNPPHSVSGQSPTEGASSHVKCCRPRDTMIRALVSSQSAWGTQTWKKKLSTLVAVWSGTVFFLCCSRSLPSCWFPD